MDKQDKVYYKIGLYNQKNKALYKMMHSSGSRVIKDFNKFNRLIKINTLLTKTLNNKYSSQKIKGIINESIQQSK